jgi:hypothetical protein
LINTPAQVFEAVTCHAAVARKISLLEGGFDCLQRGLRL